MRSAQAKIGSSMSSWNSTSTQTWQNSPCGIAVWRWKPDVLEPGCRDLGATRSPERSPSTSAWTMRPKLSWLYWRAIVVGRADRDELAALDQHRAVAEALDGRHVVGHEDDRLARGLELLELLEALVLERGVADREHLVDEQDVGVDLDRDREAEPHAHARRVVLELEVEELLELGEGDDLVEALARLLAREPEHDRVDEHVLARRQLGVEADAELDERRQPAVDLDRRPRRPRRCPARHFSSVLLPEPLRPTMPKNSPCAMSTLTSLSRVQLVVGARAERVQRALLERRVVLVRQPERLGDVLQPDCCGRRRVGDGGVRRHARRGAHAGLR